MAINFPASPSTNDTHTENTITWIFNGTSWNAQGDQVTAASIGLGSVDNTSDLDKPVSTATQTALDDKQDILAEGAFVDGDKTKLDNLAEFNVLDYGAVGDDSTDNTEAINLAIRAANNAGGGVVVVPAGVYRLELPSAGFYTGYDTGGGSNPCLLLLANVDLRGEGMKSVLKLAFTHTAGSPPLLKVVGQDDFSISCLKFLGNSPGGTSFISGENTAVDLKEGCQRYKITDCEFKNFSNEGIDNDVSTATQYEEQDAQGYCNLVENCRFIDIGGSGYHNAYCVKIIGCLFDNVAIMRYNGALASEPGTSGQGCIDGTAHKILVENCEFKDSARAIHNYLAPLGAVTRAGAYVRLCRISGMSTHPMDGRIDSVSDTYITGSDPSIDASDVLRCEIINDKTTSNNIYIGSRNRVDGCVLTYVALRNGSSLSSKITNNRITTDTSGSSIDLEGNGVDDVLVSGNTITQEGSGVGIGTNSSVTQTNCRIVNNRCTGGSRGARIKSQSVVSGNIFTGTAQESIRIDGDDNMVIGNIVSTTTQDSGTGNTVVNNLLI